MNAEGFFEYARERYRIKLLRDIGHESYWLRGGKPRDRAWTDDPILQQYRFCNVFREDDKVTQWIRNHITHEAFGDEILEALIIARWFNRIETLEKLLPQEVDEAPYWSKNMLYRWDSDEVRRRLEGVNPIVTGAFIVKTPNGMSKLEGLIWCIEHVRGTRLIDSFPVSCRSKSHELRTYGGTLQGMTRWLCQFPFLGPFMAYEVVTDLRHTPLLSYAPDIMTWANPGPGAMRGAARVEGVPLGYFNSRRQQENLQDLMRVLLEFSKQDSYWPQNWPSWEMREVEHTLCEFDKYERARLGEGTPKQRYDGKFRHHKRIAI